MRFRHAFVCGGPSAASVAAEKAASAQPSTKTLETAAVVSETGINRCAIETFADTATGHAGDFDGTSITLQDVDAAPPIKIYSRRNMTARGAPVVPRQQT